MSRRPQKPNMLKLSANGRKAEADRKAAELKAQEAQAEKKKRIRS